jgi:hypothetical protein
VPSLHGAGMRVDTQQQKADCYAIFQRELLWLPFMVGSHYFMWCDEPALGISRDFPEDSNYGLVSETNEPYAELTATATRVNAQLAALHAGQIPPAAIKAGPPPARAAVPAPAPAKGTVEFQKTAQGYAVQTGALRLVKSGPGGDLFDSVACRIDGRGDWIELGSYQAVMGASSGGGPRCWPHAGRVTDVRATGPANGWLVLEIQCVHQRDPAWKAAYRLEFEAGRPWFRACGLWGENSGNRDLHLDEYFHYLPSKIGGDASDDEPAKMPPNYWLKVASWRAPALRVHYGVVPPQSDERLRCIFWKDTGQHPDCSRKIDRNLKPGQRWTADADEPAAVVFGLRETDDNPRPWAALASGD